jgi:hypothetical protein
MVAPTGNPQAHLVHTIIFVHTVEVAFLVPVHQKEQKGGIDETLM